MLSQTIKWSPWAIVVLVLGLSGCTTSYDPHQPRIHRQVSGGYLAGSYCGAPRRTCCGATSHCGVPYAAPYAPYRRAAHRIPFRDRYYIQPYPYPAYGRPNYPGHGRPHYPGHGRPHYPRYGGSVSAVGPYGAGSRSAYYGPYGSVHSGRYARFY